MNYFDLTGRVAMVTGASSGLGVQFAHALGSQGAKLALVARREGKLEEVKKDLESKGYEIFVQKCDVTDSDSIKNAVDSIEKHYGKIDILVNNAGLGIGEPADTMSDEVWERMMKTNIDGVYKVVREVGKIMKKNKYGRVINLGSIHSRVAMAHSNMMTAYATTKGAVLMMTKALANEWAKEGITVNSIGPAYFESEMTEAVIENEAFANVVEAYCPMGRIGKTGELDTAVLYFASEYSSYTTGQLINVDGGWTAI
ncbi:SDR family NAD(P)-dependent oxidoreductase [Peptostreptococcus faecalis]|uniref:SDR family NAD(P)-dependent oxidoreductase n=1 Tax=Peptostreptococcus faecalis TaxID=2045015 RepID=UPI002E8E2FAC|nr:SDR family oxidoreductase [Peptostreptococcus faecalis]